MVISGLALVIVLATGGTAINFHHFSISLRRAAPPLTFFCAMAALRILVAHRHSGLEGLVVTTLARQGLAPRDLPVSSRSASQAGALLGTGLGVAVAAGDLLRVMASNQRLAPPTDLSIAIVGITLGIGILGGLVVGALTGLIVRQLVRLAHGPVGRYEAGRFTVCLLLLGTPAVVWQAPDIGGRERSPAVLLSVTGLVLMTLVLGFLVLPAASARARRGRLGLMVATLGSLAVLVIGATLLGFHPGRLKNPPRNAAYPNVLLVSVSGLRSDHLAIFGGLAEDTPEISSLAARGAVFSEALTPSVSEEAAAVSILTGMYPAAHGVRQAGMPIRMALDSLPLLLAAHGYRTAAFVSSRSLGFDNGLSDMFEVFDDPTSLRDWLLRGALTRRWAQIVTNPVRDFRHADRTTEAFRSWLADQGSGPWFAWVQLADPVWTEPVGPVSGKGEEPKGVKPGPALPGLPAWVPAAERTRSARDWRLGYRKAVRDVDAALFSLEQPVRARGELTRTLVILVSEFGAPLGEDGAWLEPPASLDESLTQVPWVLAGPDVRPGVAVVGPCSLVDILPTVLGLVGLGGGQAAEGEDLSRYVVMIGNQVPRAAQSGPVFMESPALREAAGRVRGVRLGRWKLVRSAGSEDRLFLIEEGEEREVTAARGRDKRQQEQLSDILSHRQTQEADLSGEGE